MVVASPPVARSEKSTAAAALRRLPTVDMSGPRDEVARQIVKAAEEIGFFKVVNHGVAPAIISRMAQEGVRFFGRPAQEKQRAGPADPFGYGCKNIGFNGDVGEVEYVMLNTDPRSIAERSLTINSNDPTTFSSTVSGYIEAVKEVACKILNLMAEGMQIPDTSVFSDLIRDADSDSILRLNYYPPFLLPSPPTVDHTDVARYNTNAEVATIGFGAHTDPQILTILTSNDVPGLQIHVDPDVWVPVSPDPTAFFVNVGDVLQAMTNGRMISVKHRALNLNNSAKSRMSMAYFAAPPLNTTISVLPQMITPSSPHCRFRPFTWADYKKAAYSLRLGDSRLDLFTIATS
ncbi:Gibberellin 2-beta-dioxygenase 2 [Linum grandiflorum]